jgi:hypothetical protein
MECEHLLVFLADRAVIEADRHAEIVDVSPTFHKDKVGDLKRETLWKMGRRGGNAAPRQIAHNSTQTNCGEAGIIFGVIRKGVVKYVAVKIRSVRIGGRFTLRAAVVARGCTFTVNNAPGNAPGSGQSSPDARREPSLPPETW